MELGEATPYGVHDAGAVLNQRMSAQHSGILEI
jgi:hypothetical protein